MSVSFSNIRIVLVNTSHPGNIGSSARAMKTMGLKELYLVNPRIFPSAVASELATRAEDILAEAIVVSSLKEAVKDCCLVIGTSARQREIDWPMLEPSIAAQKIVETAKKGKVAVLFGNEQSGLSNEELQCCHYQIAIPTHSEFSSLNLAAAVQVICYEILKAGNVSRMIEDKMRDQFVQAEDLENFYEHLEKVLRQVEFLTPKRTGSMMLRMRRLFNRARLDQKEVRILRGILTAIERERKNDLS